MHDQQHQPPRCVGAAGRGLAGSLEVASAFLRVHLLGSRLSKKALIPRAEAAESISAE